MFDITRSAKSRPEFDALSASEYLSGSKQSRGRFASDHRSADHVVRKELPHNVQS